MRIDSVTISNFKAFTDLKIDLHENFTLLVGINGAGKTSILDALAVASGIWHVAVPTAGWRNIDESEIHRRVVKLGDTVRFAPEPSAEITVTGSIDNKSVCWTRLIRNGGQRTSNAEAKSALTAIKELMDRERTAPATAVLPVLAYYSAARLGLPSRHSASKKTNPQGGRERFDAYYHCLDGSIRHGRLNDWFLWAAVAKGEKKGRVGHDAVREAVMQCLPDCRDLWFDSERKEIVADLGGTPVHYYSLSAGQQVMLAVAADIAIKAETLNPQLGVDMVKLTPGIVMIDELDVHLHPAWQRRVVKDLRAAFPNIQFICTSHSPQVVGEVTPESLRIFDPKSKKWETPTQSFGMDSNWILEVLMGGDIMDPEIKKKIKEVETNAVNRNFDQARNTLKDLRAKVGNSEEIQFAASTIDRIEILGK